MESKILTIKMQSFKDGVLIMYESGRLTAGEAQNFASTLARYAASQEKPIVVLIDAREVELVLQETTPHFVQAASIENIRAHIVVTNELLVTQAAKILQLRNVRKNTVILHDWEKAVDYAYELASEDAPA